MNSLSFSCRVLFSLLVAVSIVFISAGCDSNDDPDPKYYWYVDADNDGYGDISMTPKISENQPEGYVADYSDCDDSDDTINPGESENYSDDIDHDCDGCAYEVCCLTGQDAIYDGDIIIHDSNDFIKLKYYNKYYTTITGNLTITYTSLFSLTAPIELQCLTTIEGALYIKYNDYFCDSHAENDFAAGLTVGGNTYISDNGEEVTCP